MRILFVCQTFLPHFEGGTERVARVHAQALREAGHEVRILAAAGEASTCDVEGLQVHFIEERPPKDPIGERLLIDRPERRAAALAVAEEFAPDVVHIQHQASLSLGLVEAFHKTGADVFVSLHDLFVTCPRFFRDAIPGVVCPPPGEFAACATCIADEAPEFEASELEGALAERARRMRAELEAAAGLLAPSKSHARRIEALLGLGAGRIGVLANGLTAPLERVAAAPLPVAITVPLELLYFGHRVRTKGLVELVRAASRAAAKSARPLHLVCLGAPLEPGLDAELVELAPPLALTLEGPFDRARLHRAAEHAHIAVFPSKALESYGLVVDEALALGLPVLCADAGALAERVGGAGLKLPSPTSDAAIQTWTEALIELAEDPACLEDWRAAIPDRMPGPQDAAAALLELYSRPRS